jgi:polyferredoxin
MVMNRKQYRLVRIAVAACFFLLAVYCVFSGSEYAAKLMSFQPGPIFVKLSGGLAMPALLFVAGLLAATFLFGRCFCSVLCPLGVTQDAIDAIHKKRGGKVSRVPNLKALRYGIAAFAFLFLAGGWAIGFRLFDPFSRFGGIVSAIRDIVIRGSQFGTPRFALEGLLALFVLAALVFWKRRIYCAAICPMGTILGLCAKHGVYRLRMNGACTGCGMCENSCPTGCIDSQNRAVDNERCVRCLNCVSFCPHGSIEFSRRSVDSSLANTSVNASRRAFLAKGISAAVGITVARYPLGGAIRALALAGGYSDGLIFPPGAADAGRFARTCTNCQLCAINCPASIIKPSAYGFGPVHLDYSHSGCQYDCSLCNAVCPTGALRRLTLEDKQWLKIGEAVFDAQLCRVVKDNTPCDLCARACPKEAIFMVDGLAGLKIPEVATFHCIGCGNCEAICPVRPKAIRVRGMEQS